MSTEVLRAGQKAPAEIQHRTDKRLRTEAAILLAAQRQFGESGYERATIRSIAAEAGVDPKLVMTYFGSKDELFLAAVRADESHDLGLDDFGSDAEGLAMRILEIMLLKWEQETTDSVVCLMRSSLTNAHAAELAQRIFEQELVTPLAAAIGGPDAEARAHLFGGLLTGLFVQRCITNDTVLAAIPAPEVIAMFRPVVRAVIGGS